MRTSDVAIIIALFQRKLACVQCSCRQCLSLTRIPSNAIIINIGSRINETNKTKRTDERSIEWEMATYSQSSQSVRLIRDTSQLREVNWTAALTRWHSGYHLRCHLKCAQIHWHIHTQHTHNIHYSVWIQFTSCTKQIRENERKYTTKRNHTFSRSVEMFFFLFTEKKKRKRSNQCQC